MNINIITLDTRLAECPDLVFSIVTHPLRIKGLYRQPYLFPSAICTTNLIFFQVPVHYSDLKSRVLQPIHRIIFWDSE